jgi:hypothetical protein
MSLADQELAVHVKQVRFGLSWFSRSQDKESVDQRKEAAEAKYTKERKYLAKAGQQF